MAPAMRKWRLLALLGVGLVLAGVLMGFRHWSLSFPPTGSGPAGRGVPQESFARPWTDRKVLLLGFGDSVTAGFGAPERLSYFNRLVKNPHDEFTDMRGICLSTVLPNLARRNMAVSGSTSIDHLRYAQESLGKQPDDVFGLVVMTSGGNDIIHNYGRTPPREGAMYGATFEQARPWIDNYRNRLAKILDLIRLRFPGGCMIFLADIYDPTDGVGDAAKAGLPDWPDGLKIHAAYNGIIRRCAAERSAVHLVPMHAEFLGHGIHCAQPWREHYDRTDPHYWYAFNLEDPNHRGYDALRRLFLIEIARRADQIAGKE